MKKLFQKYNFSMKMKRKSNGKIKTIRQFNNFRFRFYIRHVLIYIAALEILPILPLVILTIQELYRNGTMVKPKIIKGTIFYSMEIITRTIVIFCNLSQFWLQYVILLV